MRDKKNKDVENIENNLVNNKEKEFIKFIKTNFMDVRKPSKIKQFFKSSQEKNKFEENIRLLKIIDDDIKAITLAKLSAIISKFEGYSQTTFSVTIALTIFLFVLEHTVNIEINTQTTAGPIEYVASFFIALISILILWNSYNMLKDKNNKDIAVYFKTLLEEINNTDVKERKITNITFLEISKKDFTLKEKSLFSKKYIDSK